VDVKGKEKRKHVLAWKQLSSLISAPWNRTVLLDLTKTFMGSLVQFEE